MQLSLNIKDEKILDKLLWMLEHFKSDGVEIIKNDTIEVKKNIEYTDDYIQKNWKTLVSDGLSSYDDNYYESEQYKLDRGNHLMKKYQ
ncbi:MAG: hypothetical protein U9O64_03580 [Campylobacterota bacterium]|nr:hypothetical protein [Campylobacterota bacterium]